MTETQNSLRRCDNCGSLSKKFSRIYKGQNYCSTCYSVEFLRVTCSTCGAAARAHRRSSAPALCGACSRADRVCVRCEKPTPRAGLRVSGESVACPSCAPYYREKGVCSCCGQRSSRLLKGDNHNLIGRVCLSCLNRFTHATCFHCGRYRRKAGELDSGRSYCSDCGRIGGVTHLCPGCGTLERGKGLGRCRACLNRERLPREARFLQLSLSREWVGVAVSRFAHWLVERDASSAALPSVFAAHSGFFERLDTAFSKEDDLTEQGLLDLFSVAGLRKHLLPMEFLSLVYGVSLSLDAKCKHTEGLRIEEIMRKVKSMTWAQEMASYQRWLADSSCSLRTQRLYLSTAVGLLRSSQIGSMGELTNNTIQRYLLKFPGLRNNLGALVRFLLLNGQEISLPERRNVSSGSRAILKRIRCDLITIRLRGVEAPVHVYKRVISTAFGIQTGRLTDGTWRAEVRNGEPVLCSEDEVVECPKELFEVVRHWSTVQGKRTARTVDCSS